MTLFPSACVWNCDRGLHEALRQVKETAFHFIDIQAQALETEAPRIWKELGLRVSCVALEHGLPRGTSLDGNGQAGLRKAVDHLRQVIARSAQAGARYAYVGPCRQAKDLPRFEKAVAELGEAAAASGIRLCVEHTPGKALATTRQLRDFVERLNHPNVFVLLDVGHALLSRERPSEAVTATGRRLGYIQMNDNDGKRDRHWALLDGILSLDELRATMAALQQAGYEGTIGLELKRDFASWISGMSKNRNLLLRLQETATAKSFQEPETRRKN